MNSPTLVTLDPRRLREQLQNDPQLVALVARGYTIATSCVLVQGPDGPEQEMQLALVLVPPPAPAEVALPGWARWWAAVVVLLLAGMLGCSVAGLAAG